MKLAIIGTAGRKDDAPKLTRDSFVAMSKATKEVFTKHDIISWLVSGGAAWADHIAVRAYLKGYVPNLTLHFPCDWDKKKKRFKDSGVVDYKTNPGGTANYYHDKFSKVVGIESLKDIHDAIKKGAFVYVTHGFMERNTKVAQEADAVLAMTFGSGAYIKDGGTSDTVKKYFDRHLESPIAYHFDLNSSTLHDDIIML